MGVYIVDSNFFIQAHRDSYPLDIAFSYWRKVKELADDRKIISIDKVKNEIYDKNDSLRDWCIANLPSDFFKETSEVMEQYSNISSWAVSKSSQYSRNAINEFLASDEADAFIVAYALQDVNNITIVTQEISQPLIKHKIKIPEVCNSFGVRYVRMMAMFRELSASF